GSMLIVGIDERSKAPRLWQELVQEPDPLRGELRVGKADPRDVAARPVQTVNETSFDRVAADAENDRDRRGRGPGRRHRSRPAGGEDYGYIPSSQLGRQRQQPIGLVFRPAIFDHDVAALDETHFAQPFAEG